MLLRQIILTESIPFEIKVPKLNAETMKAIEDTEKGIGLGKEYTDLEEMWKDLEKEDDKFDNSKIDKYELILTAYRTGLHSETYKKINVNYKVQF